MPVYKRSGVWYVSISHGGRRIRKTVGKNATKRQALEYETKIKSDIFAGKVGRVPEYTWSEAILRWLDNDCQRLKSAKKFESHARSLLPYTKGRLLTDSMAVVEDVKHGFQFKKLAPATINRRLSIIRRILNLAYKEWEWIQEPLGDKVKMLHESNERHVYLEPDEVNELALNCKNPHAADLIRLAAFSGLRRSEIFRVSKDNLKGVYLTLDSNTKSGKPRTIPVPEDMIPIIKRMPLPISDYQLRTNFEHARAECGMAHIKFHDLRHTYASWLVQSGVDLYAVSLLLGHSSPTVTKRYAHLAPEHLKGAVDKMNISVSKRSQTGKFKVIKK